MTMRFFRFMILGLAALTLCACESGRMWETPAVRPHEEELILMDEGVVPFFDPEEVYRATPGEEIFSPINLRDPAVIARGQKLYHLYCVHCHGKRYDGNGTVGQSFAPLPGDIRSLRVQKLPEGVLFKEISFGIPGGRQPALDTTVSITDRWRIIAHIQALGPRTAASGEKASE